jgi:hypothetical protein
VISILKDSLPLSPPDILSDQAPSIDTLMGDAGGWLEQWRSRRTIREILPARRC